MTPVDKNSEPLDAILRRAMRSQPGPATPECADAESLAAYSDRSLSARERERLETHFADCARCQILLADIARADESAREAKSAGAVPWYRRWRLAIPALAAAAAVLVFISIRRPTNVAPPSDQIVAMAEHEASATNVAAKQPPLPAPVPAAAPSAPVSVAAAAPSNEIAMNEQKPEAAPRAQAMRPGAPRALKGSVEAFGAGALMARGAPAAKVEAQPPATTTPESVAAQAASADSVSREAAVNAAPPPTGKERDGFSCGRNARGAGGGCEHSRVRIIGSGKRRYRSCHSRRRRSWSGGGRSSWRCGRGQPERRVGIRGARDNLGTRSICQLDRREERNDPAPRRRRPHTSAA